MLDAVRNCCLQLPGVVERFPFGPEIIVYSVERRMFALLGIDRLPPWLNLKCDPSRALELRDTFDAIRPGYHMNKRHWNTVLLDGSVPMHLVTELIEHSYRLVITKLPRRLFQHYQAALDQRSI